MYLFYKNFLFYSIVSSNQNAWLQCQTKGFLIKTLEIMIPGLRLLVLGKPLIDHVVRMYMYHLIYNSIKKISML